MSLYLIGQHLVRSVVMIKTINTKTQRNASVAHLAIPCGAPVRRGAPFEKHWSKLKPYSIKLITKLNDNVSDCLGSVRDFPKKNTKFE